MAELDTSTYKIRMAGAVDLFETAKAIMRQNLRRRNPEASAVEIDGMLVNWFYTRPGAELGDADGVESNRLNQWK